MNKKSREYWQGRFEQLQESLLNKSDTYYEDLDKIYKMANMDIQKEIDSWYRRFAKNNCISFVDAKKMLTTDELKEFKWTVEDYIKYGEKNAINQQWMEELENASAKVHISRLEALQVQLQQRMEVLFNNQIDDVDKLAKSIYTDGYYHTAFEIQKGFNTGFSLQSFNDNELEKIISKPWADDGINFSERIWGEYRPKLVNVVHTQLTQTLIRGVPPDRAIKTIAEKFNTTKSKAGNLVMTESAYFSSLSRNDCYNDLGIAEYEIVATLDFKTSETCRHLDGEHFPLSDYKPWVTAPPFHNRCRTTTCPYFNDEFTLSEKRAVRNEDGKTVFIDGNIRYPEWEKQFVKDGKGDIIKSNKSKTFENAKTIEEAEKYATDNLGFSKASYKDIDVSVANKVNNTITNMYEEYPMLNGFIKEVVTCKNDAPASASLSYKNGTLNTKLNLSKDDLNNLDDIDDMIKRCVDAKWWTPKDSINGIIKHELGHMIEYAATFKKYGADLNVKDFDLVNNVFNAIKSGEFSAEVKNQALQNLELLNNKKVIIDNLSEYGAKNTKEFLAEALSEDNPRPLASEVVRILKEKLEVIFND